MRKIRLKSSFDDRLARHFADDLNDAQLKAATAPDGYNLILAGPGSGKTRVIIYRVAYLIARGVPPSSILLVTFTRRAAREMAGRLETLTGPQAAEVWAGTFHHVGNRLLRRSAGVLGYGPNFTILDGEDQTDLVRLAMDDSGLFGTGRMAPKPATVKHLISYAANVSRPLDEVVVGRSPELADWVPQIAAAASAYAARKRAANAMDYDDLLGEWVRLTREFPDQLAAQGRMFRHILIDEMQDTNAVQVALVESIAAAGSGNLTAVGDDAQSIYRFRGADYDNILKFPDRHPSARVFRLETNYRSSPEIVAFTNASIAHNRSGFPKTLVSARPAGQRPVVVPAADAYEEADFVCQSVLENHEQGLPLARIAVLYRNHFDSIVLQGELVARGIPYSVRSGLRFFEQAHIKDVLSYLRIVVNPRDEPAWRRLLLHLPGVGQAKASALCSLLIKAADPHAAMASAGVMAAVPARGKGLYAGFVADLRKIQAAEPESNPAAAIGAILQGGYPAVVRARYERPENRLADVEQLAVLAARYSSLERMIGELLLAGDVYGMDTVDGGEPEDSLVLSTVHQAKGLEWSRVFVVRLVEDSFPHRRALDEPGGEDEERRIFYVAVTRAMDELYLVYPLTVARGGRGPMVLATPSRFLTEVGPELYEPAVIERDFDLNRFATPIEGPEGVMDAEPSRETPAALLDSLRDHPEWTDRERDAVLDRLVERFPADELIEAALGRLDDLGGGDAETLLRLIESHPRPRALAALADALAAQPELPPERAWDALAVLDGAGVLGDHPGLAERWDELNEGLDEAGSIEELVDQIEGDPEGIWLALQGLVAVEPEVRPEIVAGLARVPLGPGLVEFLRLLAYTHDGPTRAAALAALSADTGSGPALRQAWLDLAAHHPLPDVAAAARRRLGDDHPELPALVSRSTPVLVRSLVTSIDGRGRGRIVLSASQNGRRATAVFLCDVERGVVDLAGGIEPESPEADTAFDEIAAGTDRELVVGADQLSLGLLAGGLLLSGASAPPSWRFWVEATVGPITPQPFRTAIPGLDPESLSPAEAADRARAVLDACPDWLDDSPLTYELAEEILLREGAADPDPKRDSGAYRFLFEHRLKGQLETYRRMLLWMSGFWQGAGNDFLTRAALELASQLSDAQHIVPGHPFTVALTTRSLAAAQDGLRRGDDPRRTGRP